MAQPDTVSFTWMIDNFANVDSYTDSSHIECKQAEFWMAFYPKNTINNHISIYLFRDEPHSTDLKVMWTISLINDKGEECYRKAQETNYTVQNEYDPIDGGLYHLDRNTILSPSNGLLSRGSLIVNCTVTIIDDQTSANCAKPSIDDKKITLAHKNALENYQSLLDSSKFSDVVFVIGSKEFKLHKNFLSVQSPVFAAMFDSNMEEAIQNRADIIDVDVEVFEAMILFIYTGNVDSVHQYALELFVAADKYQLDSLKDICADVLGSNLTIESVANILLLADMHSAQELKSNCVKYINENASKVIVTDGWKQLVERRLELVHELYRDLVVMFDNK